MGEITEMSKTTKPVPYKLNTLKFLIDRELGAKHQLGYNDDISVKLYRNIDSYQANIPLQQSVTNQGGVFNLEFSIDGGLLVAACEERSVLIFDASNQKLVTKITDAHCKCVNCVRFLDTYTFATCSDDSTIKLWDTRNLKAPRRNLQGHCNWVKNIEYSEKEKLLVTSAFDGSIYAWDLNSPTENNLLFHKVFVMNGLMRTKLTPDGSKMVVCTTGGYIIIIHDLNLMFLNNDMRTFRPQLYRLMQNTEQTFPAATMFNYLFMPNRNRNRLEFIDDFPNDAELISSLQIHPMGWAALSRNVNSEENEEWTSVHDIQTRDPSDYNDAFLYVTPEKIPDDESDGEDQDSQVNARPTDIWISTMSNEVLSAQRAIGNNNIHDLIDPSMGVINSGIIDHHSYDRHFKRRPQDRHKIVKNIPRLTHFVKETNVAKGYIKELCFSSDGRIICSPYDHGIRLLGFNEHLHELCSCVPDRPKELFTLTEMNNYHPDVVVSCKFSPRHYQMVSGCLSGHIVWYRPIL